MFALGFLLLLVVFMSLLALVSRLIPSVRLRAAFILLVLCGVVAYPFLYKLSSSYHTFLRLCEQPDRLQVVRTQPVDFIFLEWGYATDCSKGPAFIEGRSYLGFDCLRVEKGGPKLYRYTKGSNWKPTCGLPCFDVAPIDKAELSYKSESRSGFMDGDRPVVTYFRGIVNKEGGEKFFFTDRVLWGTGEMAYSRDYYYAQYGTGWAKILGFASGSAPTLSCSTRLIRIDPRDVFPPKAGVGPSLQPTLDGAVELNH